MVDHHQRSRHPPCYHLWSGSTELWTLSANVSSIISTVHMRAAAPYGHTWAVKKYTKLTTVLHLSKQLRRSGRTYSVVLEDLRNRRGKLHMTESSHVLRYLRGTYHTDKGIQFGRSTKLKNILWGWVDVDLTGDTGPNEDT